MKKSEILALSILSTTILTAIALMDYFSPGLDLDTRRRNIEWILIFSAMILFLVVPKIMPEQAEEDLKETPFFLDLLGVGLAFFIHSRIESSLGGLMRYPFFTAAGSFDSRSALSFLIYILLLYGATVVLKTGYFYLTNRREEKIKKRRKIQN